MSIAIEVVKVTVYFGAFSYFVDNWFGMKVGKEFVWITVVAYVILCWLFGWLDEKYGIWKLQNDYVTKELTPFFKDVEEKLDRINSWKQ